MKESPKKDKSTSILIIGAGLGGLALAQGLTKAGFSVTVFERDQNAVSRIQGYRITMRSLGMEALAGLLPSEIMKRLSTAKISDVGNGFTFANEKMQPLLKIAPGHDAATQLLRSELRNLLLENIQVEWNKRLVSIEDKNDQVVAHFEDGTHAVGDFLVGCDGGSSIVRDILSMCGAKLESIPKVVNANAAVFSAQINRTREWEKLLPLNHAGMVRYLSPGSNYMGVTFSERADRSPTVFWGITEKTKNDNALRFQFDQGLECRKQILDHCKELMENEPWHETLKKLVNDALPEDILVPWIFRTTQFSDEPCQFPIVPSGKVTLLGDAAHIMPPGQGMGGSHVLEDARLLTELLESTSSSIDWVKLTETYERKMFERARKLVQESNDTDESHKRIRLIPPKVN